MQIRNEFFSLARSSLEKVTSLVIDSTFIDRESTFTRERFSAARHRPLGGLRARAREAGRSYACKISLFIVAAK